MTALVTYHNDAALKSAFLGEIGKHEALDALVKGSYGRMNGHFKGCAIGCSHYSLQVLQGKTPRAAAVAAEKGDHASVAKDLGWPLWLAYLEDNLFERLPDDLSKTWPRRLAEAIPVGVTVPDLVVAKILRWTLLDARFGVVHTAATESGKTVVRTMGALFDRTIAGENVPEAEWNKAAWDAWDARDAATRDAFYPALSKELLRLLRELAPSQVDTTTGASA